MYLVYTTRVYYTHRSVWAHYTDYARSRCALRKTNTRKARIHILSITVKHCFVYTTDEVYVGARLSNMYILQIKRMQKRNNDTLNKVFVISMRPISASRRIYTTLWPTPFPPSYYIKLKNHKQCACICGAPAAFKSAFILTICRVISHLFVWVVPPHTNTFHLWLVVTRSFRRKLLRSHCHTLGWAGAVRSGCTKCLVQIHDSWLHSGTTKT